VAPPAASGSGKGPHKSAGRLRAGADSADAGQQQQQHRLAPRPASHKPAPNQARQSATFQRRATRVLWNRSGAGVVSDVGRPGAFYCSSSASNPNRFIVLMTHTHTAARQTSTRARPLFIVFVNWIPGRVRANFSGRTWPADRPVVVARPERVQQLVAVATHTHTRGQRDPRRIGRALSRSHVEGLVRRVCIQQLSSSSSNNNVRL
jgi:hypothetical protein